MLSLMHLFKLCGRWSEQRHLDGSLLWKCPIFFSIIDMLLEFGEKTLFEDACKNGCTVLHLTISHPFFFGFAIFAGTSSLPWRVCTRGRPQAASPPEPQCWIWKHAAKASAGGTTVSWPRTTTWLMWPFLFVYILTIECKGCWCTTVACAKECFLCKRFILKKWCEQRWPQATAKK